MEETEKNKKDFQKIKIDMGDCLIPVNIQVRRNDLKGLDLKIQALKKEFSDLQTAIENLGDKSDLDDITDLISQIDQNLNEKERQYSILNRH